VPVVTLVTAGLDDNNFSHSSIFVVPNVNLTIGGTAFASQYSDCCLQSVMAERVREFIQAILRASPRRRWFARATAAAQRRTPRIAMVETCPRPSTRPLLAITDGDLWPGRERGTASQARWRGAQDNRVAEFGAARLPAANKASRFADRPRLSCRAQHASGAGASRPCLAARSSRVWRKRSIETQSEAARFAASRQERLARP
jgi:hypothetical protein